MRTPEETNPAPISYFFTFWHEIKHPWSTFCQEVSSVLFWISSVPSWSTIQWFYIILPSKISTRLLRLLKLVVIVDKIMGLNPGELKRLTPAPWTTHWPPLHGLPYGPLHGLPYGLPVQTTLNNQPNSFYGVQKYKKPASYTYTIITAWKTPAIFFSDFLDPFFTGHLPKRCFHNVRSVSAVEYNIYLFNLPQVFAIDINNCYKATLEFSFHLEK